MRQNFDDAFDFVMEWEGGYVDDPDDPGGATKWGIAMNRIGRTLGFRHKDQITGLTKDQAKTIYREHYWDKCRCDDVPPGIDIALFDSAVNQGQTAAVKFLQRSLGVAVDGVIGPVTIAAAQRVGKSALLDMMVYRSMHYTGLSKFTKYGRGWMRRLFSCYRTALAASA